MKIGAIQITVDILDAENSVIHVIDRSTAIETRHKILIGGDGQNRYICDDAVHAATDHGSPELNWLELISTAVFPDWEMDIGPDVTDDPNYYQPHESH